MSSENRDDLIWARMTQVEVRTNSTVMPKAIAAWMHDVTRVPRIRTLSQAVIMTLLLIASRPHQNADFISFDQTAKQDNAKVNENALVWEETSLQRQRE